MKIEDFSYSKPESRYSVEETGLKKAASGEEKIPDGSGATETPYSKGESTIETAILFIISGGDTREKNYFNFLRKERARRIRIAFRSKKGQGLTPDQMYEIAQDTIDNHKFILENGDSYTFEEGDTLYMIQDMDEFRADILKLTHDPYENSIIKWVVSNPCFEIWLFYHYQDDLKLLESGIALSEKEKSQWLKRILPTIIKGGICPEKDLVNAPTAIKNSKIHYHTDSDGLPGLYSTDMHELAQLILDLMGEEFDQILRQREERIRLFRKGL